MIKFHCHTYKNLAKVLAHILEPDEPANMKPCHEKLQAEFVPKNMIFHETNLF